MSARARLFSWTFQLDRIARALAIAREELAFRLLDEAAWVDLSRRMYAQSSKYMGGSAHNESGLFEFERNAVERFFPAPPASVLVGACGGGRELFGLLTRGYRIASAYDPVTPFIETLRRDPRLSDVRDRLLVGTHQELERMRAMLAKVSVDAAIVGWGSYTHLLRTAHRVRFLESLRATCPGGPVLLSFFVAGDAVESERPSRLRSNLRAWLGTSDSLVEPGDGLHRGTGGIHYFTEAALKAEAEQAGYEVRHYELYDWGAAYAVLVPTSPGAGFPG